MSSDDTASWHHLNKILLSMLIGTVSHWNACLPSLVVSPGSWVCAGAAFGRSSTVLVPMRAAPAGSTGGRWGCQALDQTRGGLLCCLPSLSILWHLAAAGPLTLMSWPSSSLPNCILPGGLNIPGEDSGVTIALAPSPKQCYTKGGLVLEMKPVLFRNLNLDLRM